MNAPASAPDWRSSLSSAMSAVTMQVTPENVLDIRKILLQESAKLLQHAARATQTTQFVGPCGGDPVSQQASVAFSQRIALLVEQCRQYGNQLATTGNTLGQIAKNYGYTELQIERSFSSIKLSPLT